MIVQDLEFTNNNFMKRNLHILTTRDEKSMINFLFG